ASFLLGQVQNFSIDLRQQQIQERARFQEYFVQDDWKVSDRLTINPGVRYTLNFPSTEINGQTGVFNLQTQTLEYPGANPVRPLKKDDFGPRLGAVYRVTDRTIASGGYALVWIEMAGITTPFTTPTIPVAQLMKPFPAYQTVSLYRNNVGTTRYDGLELSLRRRSTRGLSYTIAYTRSKLVDDASSVFDASILTGPVANYPVADSFNRALERDYSTGDIPHYFVSSVVWDLPAGTNRAHQLRGIVGTLANDWTVTSIVTLQS